MQNYPEPIIELQREAYEIRVYENLDGFMIYWGDYVFNSWVKAFETLAEVFAYCALIDVDGNQGGEVPFYMRQTLKDLLERSEN